jgi:signal transduction histidine kinase
MVAGIMKEYKTYNWWTYLLMVFVLLYSRPGYSQENIDSLLRQVTRAKDSSLVDILNQLSLEYSFYATKKSLEYADKAYDKAKEINYQKGISDALNRFGRVYSNLGMNELAMNYSREALALRLKINDLRGVASSYHILGFLCLNMNEIDTAYQYFLQSAEVSEKIGDPYLIGNANTFLAQVSLVRKNPDEAIRYYQIAIEQYLKVNRFTEMCTCYNNLGDLFLLKNQVNDAMYQYQTSVRISAYRNIRKTLAHSYRKMGEIDMNNGSFNDALNYLTLSRKACFGTDSLNQIRQTNQDIYELYRKKGDDKSAMAFLKEYETNHDSIEVKNNRLRIANLNTKFDTRLKNDSIEMLRKNQLIEEMRLIKNQNLWKYYCIVFALLFILILIGLYRFVLKISSNHLLNAKNSELAKINEELRKSEQELIEADNTRNKFFSVIAHDLVSPFNALLNFTEFQLLEIQTTSRAKIREYSNIIYLSSKNLYGLLENLLEWSETQADKIDHHPEMIELSRIISSVLAVQKISADKKTISLVSKVPPGILVFVDANMLNTVLRNLINNAIKFTRSHGTVEIEAVPQDHEVIIAVKDNGVGIKEDQLKDLFRIEKHISTRGTANEGGTGLGLIICKEFVEKNRGRIWAESKASAGTTFRFTILTYTTG